MGIISKFLSWKVTKDDKQESQDQETLDLDDLREKLAKEGLDNLIPQVTAAAIRTGKADDQDKIRESVKFYVDKNDPIKAATVAMKLENKYRRKEILTSLMADTDLKEKDPLFAARIAREELKNEKLALDLYDKVVNFNVELARERERPTHDRYGDTRIDYERIRKHAYKALDVAIEKGDIAKSVSIARKIGRYTGENDTFSIYGNEEQLTPYKTKLMDMALESSDAQNVINVWHGLYGDEKQFPSIKTLQDYNINPEAAIKILDGWRSSTSIRARIVRELGDLDRELDVLEKGGAYFFKTAAQRCEEAAYQNSEQRVKYGERAIYFWKGTGKEGLRESARVAKSILKDKQRAKTFELAYELDP